MTEDITAYGSADGRAKVSASILQEEFVAYLDFEDETAYKLRLRANRLSRGLLLDAPKSFVMREIALALSAIADLAMRTTETGETAPSPSASLPAPEVDEETMCGVRIWWGGVNGGCEKFAGHEGQHEYRDPERGETYRWPDEPAPEETKVNAIDLTDIERPNTTEDLLWRAWVVLDRLIDWDKETGVISDAEDYDLAAIATFREYARVNHALIRDRLTAVSTTPEPAPEVEETAAERAARIADIAPPETTTEVDRVEMIGNTGRLLVKRPVSDVVLSLQDSGRTLKVFLTEPEETAEAVERTLRDEARLILEGVGMILDRLPPAARPSPLREDTPASEGEEDECANCEEEGPTFRWYAQNGDLLMLCEDCHSKCFAWLWDQIPTRPSSPTGETPCADCGHNHTNAATGEREAACTEVEGLGTPDDPFKECNCGWPTGETAGQGEWVRAKHEGQQRWAVSPEGVEYGSVIWSGPHGEAAIVPLAVEQAIRAEVEQAWADDHHAWTPYIARLEARATAAEAERDRLRADLAVAHANQDSLARVVDLGGQLDQLTEERDRLREAVRHMALRSMRLQSGEPGIGCDLCMRCWPEGDAEGHRDDCLAALAGEGGEA